MESSIRWLAPVFRRPLGISALVVALLAGCGTSTPTNKETKNSTEGNNPETSSARSNCEEVLDNAAQMFQPDRLGDSTDRLQVADLLNQWMPDCGGADALPPVGPLTTRLLTPLLSSESLGKLGETRFDSRDIDHLRTCLLMKGIAEHVTKPADSDRKRIDLLFQFVVRTIALTGEVEDPLPLSPFEILLFGRGTASDRAWIFSELLRQLRIDAVIVTPRSRWNAEQSATGEPPKGASFLIGVLLDDGNHSVLLYDPLLGWPVPAAKPLSEDVLDQAAATLDEASTDPTRLQKLVAGDDAAPRLTADDLKSVHVELITTSDYCRPRMLALQSGLPGPKSGVFFDPLESAADLVKGHVPRTVEFGGSRWSEADISVWPYPEKNISGFEKLDDKQSQRLLVRKHPFDAPADPSVVGSREAPELKFVPKREQLKTRLTQLLGNQQAAVKSYLKIRLERDFDKLVVTKKDGTVLDFRDRIPPEIVRMHFRAAEDGSFWIGICQYELGDYGAASQSFGDYLRRHPEGDWSDHARGMLARSYAAEGKLAAGIQSLNAISPGDPARDGHRLLQSRLREARSKSDASN